MSKEPSHVAYIVIDPKEGSDRKPYWLKVGSVFAHKNGKGFDVVIPKGVSVTGRIVCVEPKDEPKEVPPVA